MDTWRTASWIIFVISVAALPEIPSKGKQLRVLDSQSASPEDISMPRFAEPIPNVTVSVGRDALLACVVENLKGYKVAWVRVDTQTILSIHHNVITQNPRISLTYNDHRSWYLHIKEVEENDRGFYMCQINTDPMRSRKGYLQVVVPPMIVEGITSSEIIVREGSNVTLMCKARGYPEPYVMWRREDGKEMSIGGENVNVVDGEILQISKVSRLHMAAYLCVASNGVPPSISKRVQLKVQFPPMLSIPNQLEGAYIGQDVKLECHTEAFPDSINYWTTERGDMIISDTSRAGDKFETTSTINGYSKYMKLKIRNVGVNDFGSYRCVAKNSLGETDGVIKLDEILAPTTAIISDSAMLNKTLAGKRPHKNKFDMNALPDYGVEEWKDGGDNSQPPIRHPPGAFHNSAVSLGRGNIAQNIIHWINSKSSSSYHYLLSLSFLSFSTTKTTTTSLSLLSSLSPLFNWWTFISTTNETKFSLLSLSSSLSSSSSPSSLLLKSSNETSSSYCWAHPSSFLSLSLSSLWSSSYSSLQPSAVIKTSNLTQTFPRETININNSPDDRHSYLYSYFYRNFIKSTMNMFRTFTSPITFEIFIIFIFNLISINFLKQLFLPPTRLKR